MRSALLALLLLSAPVFLRGAQAQDIPAPYGPAQQQWAKPESGEWGSSAGIEPADCTRQLKTDTKTSITFGL